VSRLTHGVWAGALVAVALIAFGIAERRIGAANARAQATQDSLRIVGRALQLAADSALAAQHRAQVQDSQRLARLHAMQVAQGQAQHRADSLATALRDSLPVALQAVFDSLQGTTARLQAILVAQRDSALVLFYGARASRDTLAVLLAASQRQAQGLQVALAQARRKPFLERGVQGSIVKAVRLVLEGRGAIAFATGH
jgi:translation initiation factor 2B subunit (eIF-2B alpha/beta/delta family)